MQAETFSRARKKKVLKMTVKKFTNGQMSVISDALEKYLDRKDKIGYACARNYRKINDASLEFLKIRESAFKEYGEQEIGEDGKPTGAVFVDVKSENFSKFKEAVDAYVDIEHDVDVMMLKYDEAIGNLTGKELLELDFMFED